MTSSILTLAEAAESLGLASSTLRHQIRNGRLVAHKLGNLYIIEEAEVERYRREVLGTRREGARAAVATA
jgi:excisionase family DNA binding protein